MELVKPEPLVLGGKAYYTLSSYDAPDIEVFVPRVTEDEVTTFGCRRPLTCLAPMPCMMSYALSLRPRST